MIKHPLKMWFYSPAELTEYNKDIIARTGYYFEKDTRQGHEGNMILTPSQKKKDALAIRKQFMVDDFTRRMNMPEFKPTLSQQLIVTYWWIVPIIMIVINLYIVI